MGVPKELVIDLPVLGAAKPAQDFAWPRLAASSWVWQRALAISVVATILFAFDALTAEAIAMAIGLPHFVGALWYRHRAKKISSAGVAVHVLSIFAAYELFLLAPNKPMLLSVTAIWALVHTALDERHLCGLRPSLIGLLDICPLLIVYSALVLNLELGLPIVDASIRTAALVLGIRVLLMARKDGAPGLHFFYFSALGMLLTGVYLTGTRITITALFFSVAVYHYVSWYTGLYARVADSREKRNRYLSEMLFLHVVTVALYLLYRNFGALQIPLGYFFHPYAVYLWALAHFIFTTRVEDFLCWLPHSKTKA